MRKASRRFVASLNMVMLIDRSHANLTYPPFAVLKVIDFILFLKSFNLKATLCPMIMGVSYL